MVHAKVKSQLYYFMTEIETKLNVVSVRFRKLIRLLCKLNVMKRKYEGYIRSKYQTGQ